MAGAIILGRMALDTSSFPAYLRSLNLKGPVSTRPGRLIDGPPAEVLDLALRFGLGPVLFDTPRTRSLLANLGLNPDILKILTQRVRTRAMWRAVLEEMAVPHISEAEALMERGERHGAIQKIKSALTLLAIALNGDGYYFYTPMGERRRLISMMRRLYRLLRRMLGARTERLKVQYAHGQTTGLLHLPPHTQAVRPKRIPALLALHPLGGDKDSYDSFLSFFRQAGYATFCVDLPAHGENFDGPRLRPDSEEVGVAALRVLAAHPAIDPERLGVMGGSLGGFFAQRTAAASALAQVCLAYASPFDFANKMEAIVPGVGECFAWAVGASSDSESYRQARQFHLRDVVAKINCPICIIHGTQDHICDFTASYEIACRAKAPVTVYPLIGMDHETSNPATAEIAAPGVEWLKQNL
jgi:alpha-beta hydrolase superfamily lysophospholipase